MERERTKEAALAFIENGGHCIKRFGWAWKGGRTEPCSKEEALRLLPKFDFGEDYYELVWRDRFQALEFCDPFRSPLLKSGTISSSTWAKALKRHRKKVPSWLQEVDDLCRLSCAKMVNGIIQVR